MQKNNTPAPWDGQELPRERLLKYGPGALSDIELIAILLRTGYQGMPVLELSSSLLEQFGGLDALLNADHRQLRSVKGLGQAKIAQLAAILEMCRRVLKRRVDRSNAITSPDRVRHYLQLHFQGLEREVFACLFLDTRHRVLSLETLFQGTIDSAAVYPREIVKRALELNASAVILAHNHPSGDPEPSQADIRITQTIIDALGLVDIRVLDHMIIGAGDTVSLVERGII
ncbi:DNA repair protein RadC [Endozoicomonas sp. Mp262]|uniref:RadC family protein n=1 Tax=Endozoicomonas sp. Mp262 TaxID=2919499 RepID=UPI0021D7FAFC